jgi:hypothetical protein
MAISPDIYGVADAPIALDPVANDLVAVEMRHDKQQGKSIGSGRKACLDFGFQSHRNSHCSAVRIQAHLGYLSTKRKPKAIGTFAGLPAN